MNTPILKISSLIILDIEDQIRELQRSPDDAKKIWIWRSYNLICPLFFMILHLEQAGYTIDPRDLADINRLDDLMTKTQQELGQTAIDIQCELAKVLTILPGYDADHKGNQDMSVNEHYGYISMSAQRLWKASRSQS